VVLGVVVAASQAPGRLSPAPPPEPERRFIVAFELRADTRQEFVWPHPTFPGAAYDRVLLAIDEMPRVRSWDGQFEALRASDHLRINGRFPDTTDTGRVPAANQQRRSEEFVVKLDAGRLRVSLVLPPRAEIDPRHRRVHITVYEVEQPPDTLPPTTDVAEHQ
jgi:hypothetical protein